MSPVSRGRKKKKSSSKGPQVRRAPGRDLPPGNGPQAQFAPSAAFDRGNRTEYPQRSALDALSSIARMLPGASEARAQARAWWPDSHAHVLDAARVLLGCATPVDLEDAVCDLLGRHWRTLHEQQTTGFSSQEWLEALLDAAKPRAAEPAVRRLIYGLAVIATPGLAHVALGLLAKGRADSEEPAWLAVPPTVTAAPGVLLMRDAYGLRFGLLAHVTGPSGPPRTYLFDVDLCHGFTQVLTSGYYADPVTAAAAWRALVGVSATGTEPVAAPADLLGHVLPGGGLIDELFGQPLSDSHFHELYRGDRIVSVIVDALGAAGRPLRWASRDPKLATDLAEELTARFKTWAAATGADLPPATGPDDDVVAWVLRDWVSPGMTEELALACSPHRIAAFTAYLMNDWLDEQQALARAVLEPLARFCLEHGGVTGEAAEQVLLWARRAADEPALIDGDLGNNLNRPIDETTVTGPALPEYAR